MSRANKQDERLPSGAVVYWSRKFRRGRNYRVPVWCPDCEEERIIDVSDTARDGFMGLCHKCRGSRQSATARSKYPTADERLDNGCVNHWSELFTGAGGYLYVPVTCSDCGRKRAVLVGHTREADYTGWCNGCKNRRSGRDPGAKRRVTGGYVQVKLARDHLFYGMADSRGWVREHRLVMAESLGHPLECHEMVHHRNGRRDDNRLENLELWHKGHPTGQRVSDLKEERTTS